MTPVAQLAAVPAELRTLRGWLLWRFEQIPGEKKPHKVPYYAKTGTRRRGAQGDVQDRSRLVTFDEAVDELERGGYSGLGLALLPEWNITALDFDKCVVDGKVDPNVQQLVSGTYAEISPSKSGVRALMAGALPDKKSHATEAQFGFETFHAKGFVTITGDAISDCRDVAPLSPAVRELHAARFDSKRERGEVAPTDQPPLGLSPDDISKLLGYLDPSMGRDPWRDIGMAIHHELRGGGFEIWDGWSAGGGVDKYPGTDALESQWASFFRPRGEGPSVTIRTLIHEANKKGAGFNFSTPVDVSEFTDLVAQEREDARWLIDNAVDCAGPDSAAEVMAIIKENLDAAQWAKWQVSALLDRVSALTGKPIEKVKEGAMPPRSPFEVQSVWDFMNRPSPGWFIYDVVPRAEVVLMFGASRSGKTFLVLDMAFAVGRGVPWCGIETEKAKVIYLAAEGAGGARKRFKAYAQHNGLTQKEVDEAIGIIDATPNMRDAKVLKEIAQCIRKAGGADILIIDTLAQVIHGDENGEDMQNLINQVREHLCKPLKAMAFFIHHTGKDTSKGARGSSTLLAAVEAEFEVVRSGDARMMEVTKLKDGEEGARFGFSLCMVEVGEDEQGRPITSCVVNYTDAPELSLKAKVRGSNEKVLLDVLGRLSDLDGGGMHTNTLVAEAMQEIPLDPAKKRDLRRQGLFQALGRLKTKGIVIEEGDKVRPA